jgi:hypothetical protein
MTSLFPPRESLVVTSRLGTGNFRTFFYSVEIIDKCSKRVSRLSDIKQVNFFTVHHCTENVNRPRVLKKNSLIYMQSLSSLQGFAWKQLADLNKARSAFSMGFIRGDPSSTIISSSNRICVDSCTANIFELLYSGQRISQNG